MRDTAAPEWAESFTFTVEDVRDTAMHFDVRDESTGTALGAGTLGPYPSPPLPPGHSTAATVVLEPGTASLASVPKGNLNVLIEIGDDFEGADDVAAAAPGAKAVPEGLGVVGAKDFSREVRWAARVRQRQVGPLHRALSNDSAPLKGGVPPTPLCPPPPPSDSAKFLSGPLTSQNFSFSEEKFPSALLTPLKTQHQ